MANCKAGSSKSVGMRRSAAFQTVVITSNRSGLGNFRPCAKREPMMIDLSALYLAVVIIGAPVLFMATSTVLFVGAFISGSWVKVVVTKNLQAHLPKGGMRITIVTDKAQG
jgi:hypothetical protein